MPRSAAMSAARVGIAANVLLLLLKARATGLSDSLTIFSETLNSLADVLAAVVILLCVRWAWMLPDENHPFGHRRAEPVAGLLVAIFTGILGFEVCRTAVLSLWRGELAERIGPWPIGVLCFTAVMKAALARYFRRRGERVDSPALRASAVDCRNDVLIAGQGLVAVVVAEYGVPLLDTIAALLVGSYILYSAHRVGMENLDYLMGKAPGPELLDHIRESAASVDGVQEIDEVKAHYVGTFVHVEFTARVDGHLTTVESHDLAEAARDAVEEIDAVDRAFVHIEAVDGDGESAGDQPAVVSAQSGPTS